MTYIRRGEPLKKNCLICGTTFERPYKMILPLWEKRKFCSQKCNGASKIGVKRNITVTFTDERRAAISERMKGKKYGLGYRHTDDAKRRMSEKRRNELHHAWKGSKATYSAFHKWLVTNFGKALYCENLNCHKLPSRHFEYALLAGKEHVHDRSAYVMLCVPCHRSYDSRDNKLGVKL